MENTGFSAIVNKKTATVIFADANGRTYHVPIELDAREWLSCEKTPYCITAALPEEVKPGTYRAYLRLSLPAKDAEHTKKSAIHFANIDIFDEEIGGNFMGEFEIR